ncbi:MAG: hypothetical protein WBC18_07795 [Ottowia sp.]
MIPKLKYWGLQLAGAILMAVWEARMRLRGKWRRSRLRERLQAWKGTP